MRSARPLLFAFMLSLTSVLSAQTLPGFSDADYQRTLRENPRVLFYALSPSMPLSVEGLKEIRSAAEDLRARLVVLVDPAATAKEVASITYPELRLQRSSELRNRGLQLHQPSVIVADNHKISGAPIAGFKSRQGYIASAPEPLALELSNSESGPHLKWVSTGPAAEPSARDPLPEQILALLGQSSQPLTAESLRSSLQIRNQRLVEALRQLVGQRKVVRLAQGYVL